MAALLLPVFQTPAALFITGVLGIFQSVKNNGRGVNFQCRKGVSFRVAFIKDKETIMAAILHCWF
jgi:hypothetical protein